MDSSACLAGCLVRASFLALLLAGCAWAQGDGDIRALWHAPRGHEFQKALKGGIGFSFALDGKEVGPGLPAGWQVTPEPGGAGTRFSHPSGLTVIREARPWPEFEAVEYTLRFRNEGQADSPALSAVNAMDLAFEGDILKGVSLVPSGGGGAEAAYPPKDFALARTPLKGEVTLAAEGGCPSRLHLPFFFIENEAKASGIYVGIGWTGDWRATVRAADALRLQAGVPDLNIRLRPGEEISGPSILVGCYSGPLSSGSNALRRLVRDRYAPSVGGEPLVAPALYTTWFDIGAELDEKLAHTLADAAAAMGEEIFLLDAGWYKGTPRCGYGNMQATWNAISGSLGNWEQGEELSRFPSGLAALADYVRSKGMAFGLWFEPERVGPESLLATAHPDWVVFIPKRKWGLVDFGRREVQDYFCGILDRYIKSLRLRYIRWDMNHHDLLPYWATLDAPDRRGMAQIRYLEGLHRVEDWIRKAHPDVIVESCAGGGRRIDLATLARRHTIWISDQTMDPQIVRFHLEGLNLFIPGTGQGVAFAPKPDAYRRPGQAFPDLAFQSCFGGAFGLAGRLHEWPQTLRDQARRHVEVFKKIRRFLSGDYYLLEPQPRTMEAWSGWQFHDPATGEGFVQAFRLRSPEGTRRLVLKALDPKGRYQFTDPYTGETFGAPGAEATSGGLEFALPEMAARVLVYRKTP